jgi:hypothetical protein
LAEPAPIALPAFGKPGSEYSSLFAVIVIDYQRSKSGFRQKRCVGSGSDVKKQRRLSLFLRCFRLFFSPTQPFGKFLNALRLV